MQRYYESRSLKTRVMPASLTSVEEVMQLAGAHHITVPPNLLTELAITPGEGWKGKDTIGRALKEASVPSEKAYETIVGDEAAWRLAFTRSAEGRNEGKIIQAINIFSDVQDRLEEMVRKFEEEFGRGEVNVSW